MYQLFFEPFSKFNAFSHCCGAQLTHWTAWRSMGRLFVSSMSGGSGSSSRQEHDLLIHFNIITVCIFFPSSCRCLWRYVRVSMRGCVLCVVTCGSSQTDNHRGGRTESERDECSVYWNKCKDRLQCQTGRACAALCVCVSIVLMVSSDWLLFHTGMRAVL